MVFVVTDGFCNDIQSAAAAASAGHRCTVTRYVYEMMRSEFVDNGCRHYRSVSVLLPHNRYTDIPLWLKNTHLYVWPKQYKELFKLFHKCVHRIQQSVQ